MKQLTSRWVVLTFALGAVLFLGACHKKAVPPPPPPPPAPMAPTASLTANPTSIDKGQSVTLTWQTTGATAISIEGIGAVQPNGTQQVSPTESTTYTLTAKGDGGTQSATAQVTVNAPLAAPPVATGPSLTEEQMFAQSVKDVYFDYDKAELSSSEQASVQADAAFLQQHSSMHVTIEGHCDERGSTEYNLALGDNRASTVKNALVAAGVSADRIKTVSLGKEKPFCNESTEACWQQNRRGHFVLNK